MPKESVWHLCGKERRTANRTESMEMPSHQQHGPIRRGSCLVCLPRLQYQYHICICSQRRSLWEDRVYPNIHPPLFASSHLPWSFRGKEVDLADEREHWLGNVGLSCVDIRNPGNSVYHSVTEGRQQQGNGWEHRPTGTTD